MRRLLGYLLIILLFAVYIGIWHGGAMSYRLTQDTVRDYLRSQDIEDPNDEIKDRIWVSDSDIYSSAGYLYVTGNKPTDYNFQHPPLVKYLFGYSALLTGNPFFVQIVFGLSLLLLTYHLGEKLFKSQIIASIGAILLLIDPVFGGMMKETLLDLGQSVFALGYIILTFFYPGAWVAQGVLLGLFASSKFWSTSLIFVVLIFGYKLFLKKEKLDYKKIGLSFLVALLTFCLVYKTFNIFPIQGRILKFMIEHNSASIIGGPIALFISGYFLPWWQSGVSRAAEWSLLWPVGLIVTVFMTIKTRVGDLKFFFYLLPFVYLLSSSTQVPFTRYFIIFLPFMYLALAKLIIGIKDKWSHN